MVVGCLLHVRHRLINERRKDVLMLRLLDRRERTNKQSPNQRSRRSFARSATSLSLFAAVTSSARVCLYDADCTPTARVGIVSCYNSTLHACRLHGHCTDRWCVKFGASEPRLSECVRRGADRYGICTVRISIAARVRQSPVFVLVRLAGCDSEHANCKEIGTPPG